MHTTNYYNTFIETAPDSTTETGVVPPAKANGKTIAGMQYEMIKHHPYVYTSDDVLFTIFADRNDIPESDRTIARDTFFSKGQACLRSSPLTKSYGWGIHSDADGKVALYAVDSAEYKNFANDSTLDHKKAMRSKRV